MSARTLKVLPLLIKETDILIDFAKSSMVELLRQCCGF
jgi:hypothetical protein